MTLLNPAGIMWAISLMCAGALRQTIQLVWPYLVCCINHSLCNSADRGSPLPMLVRVENN